MTNKDTEPSQVDGGSPQAPSVPTGPAEPPERLLSHGNKVFKSGPLFLSSKGIGWTSWKKRWFILTSTSLVFYRSDPNAIPQKGNEVNLTLGGIDLNNSGSVVVKADKKLLTVNFPDGRDGRAFTLKAETSEDLCEWKTAFEEAFAQAPSAAPVTGQSDEADAADEQSNDKQPEKSLVIGRPILLALEDADGNPTFLEKALKFIEEHGVKVEGILRQAADVEHVERRIREYEQGKVEFSPEEDAHVIADCVKYVIRELPSYPVPASCCNALLEACRTDRSMRVSAMRSAICETFPEPNRRLLQRILIMMQIVASRKAENRMSSPAVAACMAPLLLRPLLSGDCELEHDFDVGGDGSAQLLQAAAAANHAQAIVITLLEEYDSLFGEGSSGSVDLYSDTEESGSESEELSGDDETSEDDGEDYGTEEGSDAEGSDAEGSDAEGSDADIDEDSEHGSSETCSVVVGDTKADDRDDDKGSEGSVISEEDENLEASQLSPSPLQNVLPQQNNEQEIIHNQNNDTSIVQCNASAEPLGDDLAETSLVQENSENSPCIRKSATLTNGPPSIRRPAVWGRAPARKNLSMESIDLPSDDEAEVQRLEMTKIELQNRIAVEAKGNAILQENLEKRKKAMHERRLTLEQDVARLQEQLQKELEKRAALESGLKITPGSLPLSSTIDEKMKADLEDIAQTEEDVTNLKLKADNLGAQINLRREQNYGLVHDQAKQTTMHKDTEANASRTRDASTRSKDDHLDKLSPRNQLSIGGGAASPCAVDPSMCRPALLPKPQKSGSIGEGANSPTTTPELSKLTNRLKVLKERRNQIADELQYLDKDRTLPQKLETDDRESSSSTEKKKKTKVLEKVKRSSSDGGKLKVDGLSVPPPTTLERGKSEGFPNMRRGSEGKDPSIKPPPPTTLERGKSEGFPNMRKGSEGGDPSIKPPRTYSR